MASFIQSLAALFQVPNWRSAQFTIDTTKAGTPSNQFQLPLLAAGAFNFFVNWGDGNEEQITAYDQPQTLHTYALPGIYNVSIRGNCDGWAFNNTGDCLKVMTLSHWGSSIRWRGNGPWYGCANMTVTATDAPYFGHNVDISDFFDGCSALTTPVNLAAWDMRTVVAAAGAFAGCPLIDANLGAWDIHQVVNKSRFFQGAHAFNNGGSPSINDWYLGLTTDLSYMFDAAWAFDQPIGDWNTGLVTTMRATFRDAQAFDQNIGVWDTHSVQDMSDLFNGALVINQPIGGWDVSQVTSMARMFRRALKFNQPIREWATGQVQDMTEMFYQCQDFNQLVGDWDVSNVQVFDSAFYQATAFKQNIGNWWPKAATSMANMFFGADLNAPNSSTSTVNYSALLKGWTGWTGGALGSASSKGLALQNNVVFHAGDSTYSSLDADAVAARAWLVLPVGSGGKGWTITDGGAAAY
ncbi:MAG: BspA family leucine-rich repeat surface protein [Phycisphaerae bacterium]|jgi:hypothetical protein